MRQWTVYLRHPSLWGKIKWFLFERCEVAECDDILFGPSGVAELSWTEQDEEGNPISKCYMVWTGNLLSWVCNYNYKEAVEEVKKKYINGMAEIANAQNGQLWTQSQTNAQNTPGGPDAQ